jgi:multidrug transporter EmrE-like cation transporter
MPFIGFLEVAAAMSLDTRMDTAKLSQQFRSSESGSLVSTFSTGCWTVFPRALYAILTRIGVAGAAILGIYAYGEVATLVCVPLLIGLAGCIVGLKLASAH